MMNFSRERYVRVYTRDTADFLELSFNAKALWVLLLRKADRDGTIALGRRGVASVARVIGHPEMWPALEPALGELLTDGCLKLSDDGATLLIPNFTEAQEATASPALRTAKWRDRKRQDRGSPKASDETSPFVTRCDGVKREVTTRDGSSPFVTPSPSAVTARDVSSQMVTSGDDARRGVTRGDSVPNRTVPYQLPPTPPEGDGWDGASDVQAIERERRADVEAVAARGRLIDPALDREPSSAPPEPSAPSVRLVVDLLNDGSRGAFALVVDSNSTRLLTAKIRELFDGADAIDVEDYATLALWACPKIGNGLGWATSKGEAVSAAWLVNGSNLANAVGQALAWWRRTGHRQHRAALDELLTRHGVEPADELESDDGDAGEEHVPRAPEAPAPPPAPTVAPAIARERMRAAKAALAAAGSAQPSRTAAPSVDPRPSARTSERLDPAAGTGRPLAAEDAEAAAAKIEARRVLLRAQLEEAAAREAEQTSIRPSAAKVQPEEPESARRAAGGER